MRDAWSVDRPAWLAAIVEQYESSQKGQSAGSGHEQSLAGRVAGILLVVFEPNEQ